MRGRRGITLIEGMFSFLLVLLILGALTKTLVNAGKVRSNRENMDRAVDELHVLNTMRADIVDSLVVAEPLVGETTNTLKVSTVDPNLSFLQRIDSSSRPDLPYEPGEQVEVLYRIQNGILQRSETRQSGSKTLSLLESAGFEARREGAMITLTLDFAYSRVVKSRVLKVDVR